MENKFKDKLYKIFKKDSRLWDKEKKEFNETLLKDLIDKLDEKIIELLFGDKEAKEKFFIKIKDIFVLRQNDLKFFIDENKLDNSYTQYQNKIGLRVGNKLLSERDEVVLDWPFKDCVLEGGMTKEDQKRNEIFFNEVLAKDEIDRLYDSKALVNWKRYTAKGEEKVKELKRDKDGTIRENLIIKGNNLLALHSLKEQFAGKVKLIYIDPPYNTENGSFNYNDNFNHSSWLSFMKNRLEIAKDLLTSDGSIYINIDYNETHYLKILMDEVFGRKNFQREIIWRIGWLSGYKTIAKNYIRNHDTILFYTKDSNNFVFNKAYNTIKDYADRFNAVNKKEILEKLEQFKLCKKDREEFFKYISEIGLPKKYPLEDTWNSSIYDKLNSIAVVSYSGEKVSKMLGVDEIKGQKSEKLLQRIIEVSTNENDIVLDYHIGTGTTCAVAHKLNRQYIGIEQMDYIENTAVARLKEVIKGERAGVSVSVEWQGGGDFVYLELAKWNEEAREKILKAKSLSELEKLFDELYERYFLNYNVKTKEFKEKTIKEEEFKKLGLDKQKKLFVEMLDMNQMYVNFSERADKKYKLTKEDIALSEEFYNSK